MYLSEEGVKYVLRTTLSPSPHAAVLSSLRSLSAGVADGPLKHIYPLLLYVTVIEEET